MVDSVAMADLITNIKKNYLESSVYGVISQSYLTKIQRAISLSMGVFFVKQNQLLYSSYDKLTENN